MLRMLDLFSGIGGFSLGCEATNRIQTIAFCEIDPFCQKVLAKHWPNVPIFDDITKLCKEDLDKLGKIDIICGGFPCQDISCAGKGAGIHAERSGLWWEMLKIVRLVRPRYVLVENVAALVNRGLDEVLGSLAEIGYDAEWACLCASEFGALHRRERIFIVAYDGLIIKSKELELCRSKQKRPIREQTHYETNTNSLGSSSPIIFTNANRERIQRIGKDQIQRKQGLSWCENIRSFEDLQRRSDIPKPLVCGNLDGISRKLDNNRLRALGNAIVPQCAQYIAECVLAFEDNCKPNPVSEG